jgi:DNA methylase
MAGQAVTLNAICPYFTMFPLEFPLRILNRADASDAVIDPFAGRGTTAYAARLLGLYSAGIDSNPVAAAVSRAKIANTSPASIVRELRALLAGRPTPVDVPGTEFWKWAFHEDVLTDLCRLREALAESPSTPTRNAIIAIALGALHGPLGRHAQSYLSNQSPRTYAPKPAYALRYWKARDLRPPRVNVVDVLRIRADRFYSHQRVASGVVVHGDSRDPDTFGRIRRRVQWVITSPPYYGMRTYGPDQWLRDWFLGGPPEATYKGGDAQVSHKSPNDFVEDLRKVWENVAAQAEPGARLVIRFGGIGDRPVDHRELVTDSLSGTTWRITTVVPAGTAEGGRRQATSFLRDSQSPRLEYDFWARQGPTRRARKSRDLSSRLDP